MFLARTPADRSLRMNRAPKSDAQKQWGQSVSRACRSMSGHPHIPVIEWLVLSRPQSARAPVVLQQVFSWCVAVCVAVSVVVGELTVVYHT